MEPKASVSLAEPIRRARFLGAAAFDRARLRMRRLEHPGFEIDPAASPAFAAARFNLAPGARLRIAAGAATERIPRALAFIVHEDAEIVIERGAWLRTEVAPIVLSAYPGSRLVVGPEVLLNGCTVSAHESVHFEWRSMAGPGTRIYDSDHDLDADRPRRVAPVRIGECTWIAADCTLMPGVQIGSHSVVGAQSVVTADVPDHSLVFGSPARVQGPIGDRTKAR